MIFRLCILLTVLIPLLSGCVHKSKKERQLCHKRHKLASLYERQEPILTSEQVKNANNLKDFLKIALIQHPKVKTAYYDWIASLEEITTQRYVQDPQLTFQMDIEKMVTSIMPGLVQEIPGPGKIALRAAIATEASYSKYYQFCSSLLETAFTVKNLYYDIDAIVKQIQFTRELLSLQSDIEKINKTQNHVARASLSQVLMNEAEQDRLKTTLANLLAEQNYLVIAWKGALGIQMQDSVPLPGSFEYTQNTLSPDTIFTIALQKNPQLNALRAELEKARKSTALAMKSQIPDFVIGFETNVKRHPWMWRPKGILTLPIWQEKIRAEIAAAVHAKESSKYQVSQEKIRLATAFAHALFEYELACYTLDLLTKQIIPKEMQKLSLAAAANTVGLSELIMLLKTKKAVIEFELEKTKVIRSREVALATLSLLIAGIMPEAYCEL